MQQIELKLPSGRFEKAWSISQNIFFDKTFDSIEWKNTTASANGRRFSFGE